MNCKLRIITQFFRDHLIKLPAQGISTAIKERWDLMSAVCVERKPIITRDYNELELKVSKLLHELEYERSYKSNFEIRRESDAKRKKDIKEGNISIADIDSAPQQTADDFLDFCTEELKAFKFAHRTGDETIENNPKCLERKLDRNLVLIIKDKVGNNFHWILPQGKHKEGETLRQTAERVLSEKCGNKIDVKFMGNAPFGFYKYKYPRPARKDDIIGAKIFFFKAQMIKGEIEDGKDKCTDFKWATRSEMESLPPEYLKSIKMFLIDEEH